MPVHLSLGFWNRVPKHEVTCIAVSSDLTTVVTGTSTGEIGLWDHFSQDKFRTSAGLSAYSILRRSAKFITSIIVTDLDWGYRIVAAHAGGILAVWDMTTGYYVGEIRLPDSSVCPSAYAKPDAAASAGWTEPGPQPPQGAADGGRGMHRHQSTGIRERMNVTCMASKPGSPLIAVGGCFYDVLLVDIRELRVVRVISGEASHNDWVTGLGFCTLDGVETIVSASLDGSLLFRAVDVTVARLPLRQTTAQIPDGVQELEAQRISSSIEARAAQNGTGRVQGFGSRSPKSPLRAAGPSGSAGIPAEITIGEPTVAGTQPASGGTHGAKEPPANKPRPIGLQPQHGGSTYSLTGLAARLVPKHHTGMTGSSYGETYETALSHFQAMKVADRGEEGDAEDSDAGTETSSGASASEYDSVDGDESRDLVDGGWGGDVRRLGIPVSLDQSRRSLDIVRRSLEMSRRSLEMARPEDATGTSSSSSSSAEKRSVKRAGRRSIDRARQSMEKTEKSKPLPVAAVILPSQIIADIWPGVRPLSQRAEASPFVSVPPNRGPLPLRHAGATIMGISASLWDRFLVPSAAGVATTDDQTSGEEEEAEAAAAAAKPRAPAAVSLQSVIRSIGDQMPRAHSVAEVVSGGKQTGLAGEAAFLASDETQRQSPPHSPPQHPALMLNSVPLNAKPPVSPQKSLPKSPRTAQTPTAAYPIVAVALSSQSTLLAVVTPNVWSLFSVTRLGLLGWGISPFLRDKNYVGESWVRGWFVEEPERPDLVKLVVLTTEGRILGYDVSAAHSHAVSLTQERQRPARRTRTGFSNLSQKLPRLTQRRLRKTKERAPPSPWQLLPTAAQKREVSQKSFDAEDVERKLNNTIGPADASMSYFDLSDLDSDMSLRSPGPPGARGMVMGAKGPHSASQRQFLHATEGQRPQPAAAAGAAAGSASSPGKKRAQKFVAELMEPVLEMDLFAAHSTKRCGPPVISSGGVTFAGKSLLVGLACGHMQVYRLPARMKRLPYANYIAPSFQSSIRDSIVSDANLKQKSVLASKDRVSVTMLLPFDLQWEEDKGSETENPEQARLLVERSKHTFSMVYGWRSGRISVYSLPFYEQRNEVVELLGHTGEIKTLNYLLIPNYTGESKRTTFRPLVVSGSSDCTLRVWSVVTKKCLVVFRHHSASIAKVLVCFPFPPKLSSSRPSMGSAAHSEARQPGRYHHVDGSFVPNPEGPTSIAENGNGTGARAGDTAASKIGSRPKNLRIPKTRSDYSTSLPAQDVNAAPERIRRLLGARPAAKDAPPQTPPSKQERIPPRMPCLIVVSTDGLVSVINCADMAVMGIIRPSATSPITDLAWSCRTSVLHCLCLDNTTYSYDLESFLPLGMHKEMVELQDLCRLCRHSKLASRSHFPKKCACAYTRPASALTGVMKIERKSVSGSSRPVDVLTMDPRHVLYVLTVRGPLCGDCEACKECHLLSSKDSMQPGVAELFPELAAKSGAARKKICTSFFGPATLDPLYHLAGVLLPFGLDKNLDEKLKHVLKIRMLMGVESPLLATFAQKGPSGSFAYLLPNISQGARRFQTFPALSSILHTSVIASYRAFALPHLRLRLTSSDAEASEVLALARSVYREKLLPDAGRLSLSSLASWEYSYCSAILRKAMGSNQGWGTEGLWRSSPLLVSEKLVSFATDHFQSAARALLVEAISRSGGFINFLPAFLAPRLNDEDRGFTPEEIGYLVSRSHENLSAVETVTFDRKLLAESIPLDAKARQQGKAALHKMLQSYQLAVATGTGMSERFRTEFPNPEMSRLIYHAAVASSFGYPAPIDMQFVAAITLSRLGKHDPMLLPTQVAHLLRASLRETRTGIFGMGEMLEPRSALPSAASLSPSNSTAGLATWNRVKGGTIKDVDVWSDQSDENAPSDFEDDMEVEELLVDERATVDRPRRSLSYNAGSRRSEPPQPPPRAQCVDLRHAEAAAKHVSTYDYYRARREHQGGGAGDGTAEMHKSSQAAGRARGSGMFRIEHAKGFLQRFIGTAEYLGDSYIAARSYIADDIPVIMDRLMQVGALSSQCRVTVDMVSHRRSILEFAFDAASGVWSEADLLDALKRGVVKCVHRMTAQEPKQLIEHIERARKLRSPDSDIPSGAFAIWCLVDFLKTPANGGVIFPVLKEVIESIVPASIASGEDLASWAVAITKLIHVLGDQYSQVAYHGSKLAFGQGDGAVYLFDVGRDSSVRVIKGNGKANTALCFSEDGSLLASFSERAQVLRVWRNPSSLRSLVGINSQVARFSVPNFAGVLTGAKLGFLSSTKVVLTRMSKGYPPQMDAFPVRFS